MYFLRKERWRKSHHQMDLLSSLNLTELLPYMPIISNSFLLDFLIRVIPQFLWKLIFPREVNFFLHQVGLVQGEHKKIALGGLGFRRVGCFRKITRWQSHRGPPFFLNYLLHFLSQLVHNLVILDHILDHLLLDIMEKPEWTFWPT